MEYISNVGSRQNGRNCTRDIDVVALQEIRWNANGKIKKGNYCLHISEIQEETGQYETGLMVSRNILSQVLQYVPINERRSIIRIKGIGRTTSFITMHTPTNEKGIAYKRAFIRN